MANSSMTSFWLKRIAVMVAVMAAAIAFLMYVPDPSDVANQSAESDEPKNSVASNVSKFYEAFKQISRDPIKERYGDYVLILDNQDDSPEDAIASVTTKNHPPLDAWQGEYKERPFSKGSTLMNDAKAFITKEGFNFVWDLNQDFIIRDRFVSNNTLVGMLEEIAGAVDANFDHPIVVYFCFKKRALVITARESEYLANNCEKSAGSYDQYY